MPGQDKQQILDALFGEPGGTHPGQPGEAYAKAHKLFFDSGIEAPVNELAPKRIWQRYQSIRNTSHTPRKQWRYIIPAVAAASVALAIGIIGWPGQNNTGAVNPFVKQSVRRENFSEYYQKSVNLYVRQTENFSVNHHDKQFEIAADSLTARIDFKATAAIKTVRIQTPQVTFEIIGTRIAIEVTPDKARLHVSEGKVRVSYANRSEIVDEGGVWEYSHGSAVRAEESSNDKKIFSQFKSDLQKPDIATLPKAASGTKHVRIYLNDGTELSGRVIRETSESVVLVAPLAGSQEILLKRENIRSMRNEGGKR